MTRPGSSSGEILTKRIPVLTGGLETSVPAHMVDQSQSPEMVNIVLNNGGAEKRAGFIPVIREQPRLSSVKNRGHHSKARINNTGTSTDADVLIVPGAAYAEHRLVYETLNLGLALDFFCRIDDLTSTHVGNQRPAGGADVYYTTNDTTPFRIRVRPILSKGPAKRWYDGDLRNGPAENSQIQWKLAASPGGVNYWGVGAQQACMPFCVYLAQDTSGNWEFQVAWHSVRTSTGNFELLRMRIPYTTLRPRVGVTYHIVFSHSHGVSGRFRVGVLTDPNALPTYYATTDVVDLSNVVLDYSLFQAPTATTYGPIQLFDCPQEFIAAPTTASMSHPPGLGLSGATDGDYWFACKRFEGMVEDVVIWSTHRLASDQTVLDRFLKLDLSAQAQTDVVNYWSMAERGTSIVRESTGRTNHFYFLPAGPIFDDCSGAARLGELPSTTGGSALSGGGSKGAAAPSWWFNGLTSYALAELDWRAAVGQDTAYLAEFDSDGNPNWRYRLNLSGAGPTPMTATRDVAFFQRMVLGNLGYGLEVTFWPGTIEPRFEQVLVEIHGVMRLAIDVDGSLVGYVRSDATGVSGSYLYQATGGGANHNHLSTGTIGTPFFVVPGQRYTASLFWRAAAGAGTRTLELRVNGVLIATVTTVSSSANGWLVSGVTIGMGSYVCNGRTDQNAGAYPATGTVASPDTVYMDPRSGFCGRIESARILAGASTLIPAYKDEDIDDYQVAQRLLWTIPVPGSTTTIRPDSVVGEEYPQTLARGHAFVPQGKKVPITDRFYQQTEVLSVYANTNVTSVVPIAPGLADPEDHGYFPDPAGGESGAGCLHTKLQTFHTLARFVLNKDDQDVSYSGTYQIQIEGTIDPGGDGDEVLYDANRGTHVQLSEVRDEVGVMTRLQRRCLESDLMSLRYLGGGAFGSPEVSLRHAGRPYRFRSPKELAPTWAPGLAMPLTGTNEITLLADWQHQKSSEQLLVAAAGRQLYWCKPAWRQESPFPEPAARALWTFGQPSDFARISCANANQEFRFGAGVYTTVTFEAWVHPQRLDGTRLIALKGDLSTSRVNYALFAIDGELAVLGTSGSGTRAWLYREGLLAGGAVRSSASLRANAWNHVYILVGSNLATGTASARVDAWVNGHKLGMVADPGFDAITAATPDAGNYPLYLCGVPDGLKDFSLASVVGTALTGTFTSWHGFITEVRQTNAEEAPFFSGANFGFLPRGRYSDSASTYLLLHLSEGEGWSFANSAAATSTASPGGSIYARELIRIGGDDEALDADNGSRYSWVVYRDELIVTNGRSNPQRIQFTRFSDPKGAFRRKRLGVQTPWSFAVGAIPFALAGAGGNSWNVYSSVGDYQFWVSFVNEDGEESDPALATLVIVTGTPTYAGFRLDHLPRSPDPQVRKRRIYVSPLGGGNALFHSDLEDNDSYDCQVFGLSEGAAVESGMRLPAPKALHVAVGSGTVFLANLPDFPAGSGAFAWGNAETISQFPAVNLAIVDSRQGKPITGLTTHLGRLYLMKRDSTWEFALQGAGNPTEAQANLRPVSESVGLPGGMTAFDNLIYGSGERGPYAFTGANHIYLGKSLKDDYQTRDLRDEGLLAQFGAFERPNSQFWLSTRPAGGRRNTGIYVLHTAVADRQTWSKLLVPEHSFMGGALLPGQQQQSIVLGTTSGQILAYSGFAPAYVDGHGDTLQNGVATKLAGTVTSGTTTSLTTTMAAGEAFDTIGQGLRGCTVRVNGVDRTIERTSGATIYWREPLSGAAAGVFSVGAYTAQYTTGWMSHVSYGHWTLLKFIDLDFAPAATALTVENQVANSVPTSRAFPEAGVESRTVDLTEGFQNEPVYCATANHGRYVRLRLSTSGIRDPWLVTGLQLRFAETGLRGKPA